MCMLSAVTNSERTPALNDVCRLPRRAAGWGPLRPFGSKVNLRVPAVAIRFEVGL